MSGTSLVLPVIGHLALKRAILKILHLSFKKLEVQERGAGFRSQKYASHLAIYQQDSISLSLPSYLCCTLHSPHQGGDHVYSKNFHFMTNCYQDVDDMTLKGAMS